MEEKALYLRVLEEIGRIWFVREALYRIVFSKMCLDGYVYCKAGLYPSNKDVIRKALAGKNSPYTDLLKKNAETFVELKDKFRKIISDKKEASQNLTTEECQCIVYSLVQPKEGLRDSEIFFLIWEEHYPKSRFCLNGDFIIANDVELIEIDTVDKYISEISNLPENKNLLFRGQTNINFMLVPSLMRTPRFYKNEYMMYQEMVVRCPDNFANCKSHLDFLVEMQHYGLPTRLLDLTLNPLVALYFACEEEECAGEVIVYSVGNYELKYEKDEMVSLLTSLVMLSYKQQKELYRHFDKANANSERTMEFYIQEVKSEIPYFNRDIKKHELIFPIFVKPVRKNPRIAHQEGAFMIFGLESVCYDENVKNEYIGDREKYRHRNADTDKKKIYYIPSDKKNGIKAILNRIGINKAYVYPEIDDVADYIKNVIN